MIKSGFNEALLLL